MTEIEPNLKTFRRVLNRIRTAKAFRAIALLINRISSSILLRLEIVSIPNRCVAIATFMNYQRASADTAARSARWHCVR